MTKDSTNDDWTATRRDRRSERRTRRRRRVASTAPVAKRPRVAADDAASHRPPAGDDDDGDDGSEEAGGSIKADRSGKAQETQGEAGNSRNGRGARGATRRRGDGRDASRRGDGRVRKRIRRTRPTRRRRSEKPWRYDRYTDAGTRPCRRPRALDSSRERRGRGGGAVGGDDVAGGGGSDAASDTAGSEELAACAALAVFVARRWRDAAGEFASGRVENRGVEGSNPSGDSSGSDEDATRRERLRVLGDATVSALARLVGGDGAVAFRRRSGAARAATLRAGRVVEHASAAAFRIGTAVTGMDSQLEGWSASVVGAVTTSAVTVLAVLGQEFCLLREHARWRASGHAGGDVLLHDDDDAPSPPPPLTPELETALARAVSGNASTTGGVAEDQTEGPAAADSDFLLERMEECHVLLLHALNALRRHVSSASGGGDDDDGDAPESRDPVAEAATRRSALRLSLVRNGNLG